MIAITSGTRRTLIAKTGDTYTASTYSGSDTTLIYVVVAVDDGWREVTVGDLATIKIKEPAKEQDEPNTDERSVTWKRPNRRLATVNRAGRTNYPRKAASTWG